MDKLQKRNSPPPPFLLSFKINIFKWKRSTFFETFSSKFKKYISLAISILNLAFPQAGKIPRKGVNGFF